MIKIVAGGARSTSPATSSTGTRCRWASATCSRPAPRCREPQPGQRGLAPFPIFTVGDAGPSAVELQVPSGYEVDIVGSPMQRSERGGIVVYRGRRLTRGRSSRT